MAQVLLRLARVRGSPQMQKMLPQAEAADVINLLAQIAAVGTAYLRRLIDNNAGHAFSASASRKDSLFLMQGEAILRQQAADKTNQRFRICLLYTSDAADE